MKESAISIGKTIEKLACEYLIKHRLNLIASNYRCKYGEIDLIMKDKETIVFVEVRHRKNCEYGDSSNTITKTKQHRIIKSAMCYLKEQNLINKVLCRFDVIATTNNENYDLTWIKDAFWEKW